MVMSQSSLTKREWMLPIKPQPKKLIIHLSPEHRLTWKKPCLELVPKYASLSGQFILIDRFICTELPFDQEIKMKEDRNKGTLKACRMIRKVWISSPYNVLESYVLSNFSSACEKMERQRSKYSFVSMQFHWYVVPLPCSILFEDFVLNFSFH
jgi:hypothetical protein